MADKTIKIEVNKKVIHSIIYALGHVDEKCMSDTQKRVYTKLLEIDELLDSKYDENKIYELIELDQK